MTARKKLWGVMMQGSDGERTGLLYTGWHRNIISARYDGEPTRPLFFSTRRQARAWCAEMNRFYGEYPKGHVCTDWKFFVVRVEQTLTFQGGRNGR